MKLIKILIAAGLVAAFLWYLNGMGKSGINTQDTISQEAAPDVKPKPFTY